MDTKALTITVQEIEENTFTIDLEATASLGKPLSADYQKESPHIFREENFSPEPIVNT